MNHLRTLINLLILLFLASCNGEKQKVNTEVIEKEVVDFFNTYVEHVNTNGLLGADQYFSDSDQFYWVEDGVIQYPNHDALKEGIKSFAPTVRSVELNVLDKKVNVINASNAMLFLEYSQHLELNNDYKFSLNGAMTILVNKSNNQWKLSIGHSSIKKPRTN